MRFALFLFAVPVFAAAGGSLSLIDAAGNLWRTGQTSFVATTATAFQKGETSLACGTQTLSPFDTPTAIGCQHAFLSRQDAAGNILYATYLGGSSQDGGTALTTDSQGNIYVAGYTYSADFPVTQGAAQTKNAGPTTPSVYTALGAPFGLSYVAPGGDAFVAKFTPDGTLLFSTLLGGSGEEIPNLIAVDQGGSIYVSGFTMSTDFPVSAGSLSGQGTSNFFARLDSSGKTITYATYVLSPIRAFDVDSQGRAYLTGDLGGRPYLAVLDTVAGTVGSIALPADLAGAGAAIALGTGGNFFLAVSPAPQPYVFGMVPTSPARTSGDSYLLELSAAGGTVLAQTHIGQSWFDSILLDTAGDAYAFGQGSGAIPSAPVQLLPTPCTPKGASFAVEWDAAGTALASTYFRQGDDSAVAVAAPGHLLAYRAASSTIVPVDLSAQPPALFGCAENLATGLVGTGLAPGEIFTITGTGIGPAQGIGAVPNASGQYPTTLGGVQVLFGVTPVPLLYVQANEIHAVAPFRLAATTAVQVQFGNGNPPPLDVSESAYNPGVLEAGGQGAIINQDGSVNTPANPAPLGSAVSVYCIGTGYLENPVIDGSVAPIPPPYNVTELTPQLKFAGEAGTTLWSGAAPGLIEGVTQVNVQLPASLPSGTTQNAVPVILNVGGVDAPAVNISVKM
ncbi:MAG TPA: SBBP repeat-containing protein [Bryobacteraceae bacterium]|nr:SBBP repeat-containing protein [Bryobacteraceae bacterium]